MQKLPPKSRRFPQLLFFPSYHHFRPHSDIPSPSAQVPTCFGETPTSSGRSQSLSKLLPKNLSVVTLLQRPCLPNANADCGTILPFSILSSPSKSFPPPLPIFSLRLLSWLNAKNPLIQL